MGGVLRKPIRVPDWLNVWKEAKSLEITLETLLNKAEKEGTIDLQKYTRIHARIGILTSLIYKSLEKDSTDRTARRVWFVEWKKRIQQLEAKYNSLTQD